MANLVLDNTNDMAWFNQQSLDERKRLAKHWLRQAIELKLPDEDITRVIMLLNWLNQSPLPFDNIDENAPVLVSGESEK